MKAGDVSVVQYDQSHGGLRVLPLRSVAEIGRLEAESGAENPWVVVGYSADEGRARGLMGALKGRLKSGGGASGE